MESNQVDIIAFAVFGDLQQIDQAQEPGLARQLWRDIRETDRRNRVYLYLSFFHAISRAYPDTGTHPDADAAGDLAAPDSIAKTLGERHEESI